MGEACAFASRLRRQGASEAVACEHAARAFGVSAVEVARAVGFRGVRELERRARR